MTRRPSRSYPRILDQGASLWVRSGLSRSIFRDAYHFLLTTPWPIFLMILVGVFVALNALFAAIYLAGGAVISNARPGNFGDAFFFSVHTLATIGYGNMAPLGLYANVVSVAEVVTGMISLALITGIAFAKFSRPNAAILFSKRAVVTMHEGRPCLMFRMANQRKNRIVEAHLNLGILLQETSPEGLSLRRFHDMKLLRDRTPVFGLTWLVIHPIDAESPLRGFQPDSLEQLEAEIVASFTGVDDTLQQNVYRLHSYICEEIEWNAVFEDILLLGRDGLRYLDYGRFHNIKKLTPADRGYFKIEPQTSNGKENT